MPPPFAWCAVPDGVVTLEDSRLAYAVPGFDIAQYPVTHEQFQAFIDAPDGYCAPSWWDFSPKAARWRRVNEHAETVFAGEYMPRVSVTWYEAMAYSAWLAERLGEIITLPTEQEWQRAAQSDDSRRYPWGNVFEGHRCNTSESGIKRPTRVDAYPSGASAFGAEDMSGNVAEWCLNAYNVPDSDDAATFSGGEMRAMRGGSWGLNHHNAKVTVRGFNHPADRFEFLGFRVARHEREE